MKIWINNRIVDAKDAKISVFDRGFLYGDGVFETMRGYDGVVFKVDEHLNRLDRSLGVVKIKIPYTKAALKKRIHRLLKINKLKNAYIRLTVTRGEGTVGLAKTNCKNPTTVIVAKKFTPYPAGMYKRGARVKIVKTRQNENSPVSGIKSVSFLNYILARLEAKEAGFDDAVMLNSKGQVCESTVSNIFLVKGRRLMTPLVKNGSLPGITRNAILESAPKVGLRAIEKTIRPGELYGADEVFLTNTLMEVMPVVWVDNHKIGSGKPGIFAKRLGLEYNNICKKRL